MSDEVKSFPLTSPGQPKPTQLEPVRRPLPANPKQ